MFFPVKLSFNCGSPKFPLLCCANVLPFKDVLAYQEILHRQSNPNLHSIRQVDLPVLNPVQVLGLLLWGMGGSSLFGV